MYDWMNYLTTNELGKWLQEAREANNLEEIEAIHNELLRRMG